jgi:hypothetical protein
MGLLSQIRTLEKQRDDITEQLALLKAGCTHPVEAVETESGSNFSYKDPLEALSRWAYHRCGICGNVEVETYED